MGTAIRTEGLTKVYGRLRALDDLDLDTSLEDVVTVVEWGEGVAESLASSRLEIRIRHSEGETAADETMDGVEPRVVEIQGIGPRWATHPNRPTDGPARR